MIEFEVWMTDGITPGRHLSEPAPLNFETLCGRRTDQLHRSVRGWRNVRTSKQCLTCDNEYLRIRLTAATQGRVVESPCPWATLLQSAALTGDSVLSGLLHDLSIDPAVLEVNTPKR